MFIKRFLLLVVAAYIVNSINAQQQVFDKNKLLLEPFEYNEVKLLESPLKKTIQ